MSTQTKVRAVKTQEENNALLEDFAPTIKFMARRLAAKLPPNVLEDDLMNAGVIGLMDASEKYDPARNTKFSTYAEYRIKGAMLDELRGMDWLPRSLRDKSRKIRRAMESLTKRHGRNATEEEVAEELGLSMEAYWKLLDEASSGAVFSLEDLAGGAGDGQRDILECIPDPSCKTPLDLCDARETTDKLARAIGRLPENERLVITLYYYEELTMKELGKVLGVTESRVSQIHTQTLIRLRGFFNDRQEA